MSMPATVKKKSDSSNTSVKGADSLTLTRTFVRRDG